MENLTSLGNVDFVLLDRKYRALPHLELWERLFDMCLVYCYDEMVRDLCGISFDDSFSTDWANPLTLTSKENSKSESLLAGMRLHVTFTTAIVFENQTTNETINVDKSV